VAERVVEWLQGPLLELDVAEIVVHGADEPNVILDLIISLRDCWTRASESPR
jgi:hypothetical protein